MIISDNTIVISQTWGKNDNSIDLIHQWMQLAKSSLKISKYLLTMSLLSKYLLSCKKAILVRSALPNWLCSNKTSRFGTIYHKTRCTSDNVIEPTFLKRFPLHFVAFSECMNFNYRVSHPRCHERKSIFGNLPGNETRKFLHL